MVQDTDERLPCIHALPQMLKISAAPYQSQSEANVRLHCLPKWKAEGRAHDVVVRLGQLKLQRQLAGGSNGSITTTAAAATTTTTELLRLRNKRAAESNPEAKPKKEWRKN